MFVYYKQVNANYGEIVQKTAIRDFASVDLYIETVTWPVDANGISLASQDCIVDIPAVKVIKKPPAYVLAEYKKTVITNIKEKTQQALSLVPQTPSTEHTYIKNKIADIKAATSKEDIDAIILQIKAQITNAENGFGFDA